MKIVNSHPSILYLLITTDKTLQINISEEKVFLIRKIYNVYKEIVAEEEFILCTLKILQMNCSINLFQQDLEYLLNKRLTKKINTKITKEY
ncbi:hypothetical protein KAF80_28125 [Bacillus sp. WL1]|uniref:hypothetical protein n=1 Tax=Bacillus sp. WL1 TaxID=2822693 RepID=UPI001B33ABAF|nr:hypothetical protein [Bacillus sp. WL1]MBP3972771.1 hypothetical protein [Bacillus sp. WL1]MEC2744668.1 hypothetical protein [Bacillus cereus]MEC2758621.1 hypothetical protein [Bacillus cereus]MEC2830413.1 hypothetical protein [Bacillus cereus]